MIYWAILLAEVTFWLFLISGLALRYILKKRVTGMALLIATPLIDLVLLILTYTDMSEGSESRFVHGLSAVYIGFSTIFGPSIIRVMDRKFARRYYARGASKLDSLNVFNSDNSSSVDQKRIWITACIASAASAALILVGIAVVGLAGSFWLLYWLITLMFIVAVWWFIGPRLSRKREQSRADTQLPTSAERTL